MSVGTLWDLLKYIFEIKLICFHYLIKIDWFRSMALANVKIVQD